MRIASIAHKLPSKVLTNEDVLDDVIRSNETALSREDLQRLRVRLQRFLDVSGTSVRYCRAANERAVEITIAAAQKALDAANVHACDVDLLIHAGVSRGWLEPAMANVYQGLLGLRSATCFDILDACAGWVRAMSVADSYVRAGAYRTILIINSEFNYLDHKCVPMGQLKNREELFPIFTIGEAAAATVVTDGGGSDNFYFSFRTWGHKQHLCKLPLSNMSQFADGTEVTEQEPLVFYANSGALTRFTLRKLAEHFQEDPRLSTENFDLVVGHAASENATSGWLRMNRVDPALGFRTHSRFGNTVSASIPLGLSVASEAGRLRRGMHVLVVVGSAGVTTAYSSFDF